MADTYFEVAILPYLCYMCRLLHACCQSLSILNVSEADCWELTAADDTGNRVRESWLRRIPNEATAAPRAHLSMMEFRLRCL